MTSNISEIQLDLLQINESIDILKYKLEILEEKPSNWRLVNETLDDLATMYYIQDNLKKEMRRLVY